MPVNDQPAVYLLDVEGVGIMRDDDISLVK
jgi:hypothetical protein